MINDMEEKHKSDTSEKQANALVNKSEKSGANPVLAIAIAIFVSAILAGIGLISFLRSDTKKNLNLIDKTNNSSSSSELNLDDSSPLTRAELYQIESTIQKELEPLRNDVDFNANELTDAALGL